MRKLSRLIERLGIWLRERYDLCEICREEVSDAECPCGKMVCGGCQDYWIFTDEVCCQTCADEIRKSWEDCPQHDYEEPYENEDGVLIEQCRHCDYAHGLTGAPTE